MVNLSGRELSREIIESCRAGDRDAFRALYETYKDRVYSISLYFFHGDAVAASDVTQQVFLKLMTSIRQFRGNAEFSTWLYRLVVNACVDTARSRKFDRAVSDRPRLEAFAAPGSPEEDYARTQMANSVRAAVSALPPKFRIAVLLRYFDDLSYEQMAKALQCADCLAEYERVKWGMAIMERLRVVEAPEGIWSSIEQAFQETRLRRAPVPRWRWAFAATVVLALAATAYWRLAPSSGTQWEVARLDGSPSVDAKPLRGVGQIGVGKWIETDAGSRATVKIGEIGSVEIQPNTRLRIVAARPSEHRLALARGEIRAKISAPPRLFFVETAAGTAVDLGCEYALSAGEDGSGFLHVAKGWVSFQWKGLESLVPAGASCRTRSQTGPGIPYFDDAPERLRQALDILDAEKGGNGALEIVLSESRVRDTLTLWHLLQRVEPADRGRLFDRMAALTPIPAGVAREQALKLDPDTLNRWKEELAWTW